MIHKQAKGFSTLEILLAGAVFVVFSWGVVEVLLINLVTDQRGYEVTQATNFAVEGMEAVKAIKQDNFDALEITEGTGVNRENNQWVFSGTEDQFENQYVRTIVLQAVTRDEEGNIAFEGDIDPDTIEVTVTVTWPVTPARSDSVFLKTYLTRLPI